MKKPEPPKNPHADLFEDWLKDHPAPSLGALVAAWGTWDKIPDIIWDDFQRRNEEWEIARLNRLYGHTSWGGKRGKPHKPPNIRPMK
jgi:hypothetical protein